ncbi:bifunctional metallophosphatase/5'-nucleotidase [Thalassomonas actiniarum]|uniref:Bifunctional metallophosphatase/5'-nucleotidase n=1 Tax=Thalassomonas actiniarum TaxID=485447 RepID=A0AAE9YV16_9GAMM|nr:bifunctional metallophosphatase/5'-nucleotidase [Thalassomonas actiniarum]WDE01656.1 bifunctional metallophosphatase/5'-nucleotidase [Thalassomonas actiniarum]
MVQKTWLKLTLLASVLTLGACSTLTGENTGSQNRAEQQKRQFTILAVNDIYNIEGTDAGKSGGMARLRTLREQLSTDNENVLLLHAGDFLFPSSMSTQYKGEQMIDLMNQLDGEASGFDDRLYVTFGNHEFDKSAKKYGPMLAKRIEESDFYWLGSNVTLDKNASNSSAGFNKSLLSNAVTTINGVKVGLFSITTDMAIPEYAAIDNNYLAVARKNISALKEQGAEVIIALTHLRISEDAELLRQLGENGPDVIFGGHEHNRQHICVDVGNAKSCVIKADADIRSAAVAKVTVSASGEVDISHRYSIVEDSTIASDDAVAKRTQHWIKRYEKEYCDKHQQEPSCLLKVIGKTDVDLIAEELEIRRYETNLGAGIADIMVSAFDDIKLERKVQIALINSGSLRLNQNIPAGSELNNWYINGIFQYPVSIRLIEMSGIQLKQTIAHSIEDWTGNGWWLQSSGLAFRHDVKNNSFSELSLIDKSGNITPVKDEDVIVAAVSDYIADPSNGDQDGYTMLNLDKEIVYGEALIDLKTTVTNVIKAQWAKGEAISPGLPGRVCSSDRASLPCVLNK